jgi:RHH-type transcriptional regulator, proline utilization regulon repressor / proline dehydrogenase / delta 1-pyrroline-5-carboxylate dehydrogenase
VAAIIAPWNFPLAILCGMTTAALVTGNCVLIKPAEQSSVTAARFAELLEQAGFPRGSFAFLPGLGEVIGKTLVEHPDVQMIAFTGSREVGLKIWETAGLTRPGQLHLKKVVCEMGGKNAVIVDSDADLDEAIPALLYSAFGYAGQKCSALSRLIVVGDAYEPLLDRLCEAARSLVVGVPEDPATVIGPLISEEAMVRVRNYVLAGKAEALVAFEGTVPAELKGCFVPPVIFRDVPPDARIAREEIFGPVLCVLHSHDFDEALQLANSSEYALTGGIFSRNPAHIKLARARFHVGNLYINRGITGALVARQPFGGFKMSGGGTKAGGRDYLLNFMYPRCITENTMRRGFAPSSLKSGE